VFCDEFKHPRTVTFFWKEAEYGRQVIVRITEKAGNELRMAVELCERLRDG
jgi:hypothetical protein